MSSSTNFKPLFSSASDNHPTPQTFFDDLNAEFGFVLDVAASVANRKTDAFYGLDHPDPERRNGLAADWAADAARLGGAVWANIPYGRGVTAKWMAKAAEAAAAGATVVCLVPSRTGTRWFHEHVLAHDAEVRFVKGRLKFGDAKNSAPFDSLVIVFRPPTTQPRPEADAPLDDTPAESDAADGAATRAPEGSPEHRSNHRRPRPTVPGSVLHRTEHVLGRRPSRLVAGPQSALPTANNTYARSSAGRRGTELHLFDQLHSFSGAGRTGGGCPPRAKAGARVTATDHSGRTVPPMFFYELPTELPLPPGLTVQLARRLATAPGTLPTPMLLAASAVLRTASREAREDVRAHSRRRGNPGIRQQAQADLRLAGDLTAGIARRWQQLRPQQWAPVAADALLASAGGMSPRPPLARQRLYDIEGMPSLGPSQWTVVAAHAPTWRGSVAELVTVARVTVPGELPIDIEPWRRWLRRRRWTEEMLQCREAADAYSRVANAARRKAHETSSEGDAARHAGAETAARAASQRLSSLSEVHHQVLGLDDGAIAAYEAAVDSGTHPVEALHGEMEPRA
jgi:site-specific DNA-methyltransferase (adenine-specific)